MSVELPPTSTNHAELPQVSKPSFQKEVMDALLTHAVVLANIPVSYPAYSLYALFASVAKGLTVVVCPDALTIKRNVAFFLTQGYQYPDLAVLDGTQMPHEVRATYDAMNHNKVHILYVTPKVVSSLDFLQMLVHADINAMIVEQSERFLGDFTGATGYLSLKESLDRLSRWPRLLLISTALAPLRIRQVLHRLDCTDTAILNHAVAHHNVVVDVRLLTTEHQKFKTLVYRMTHPESLYPNQEKQDEQTKGTSSSAMPPQEPGKVVIRCRDNTSSAKLVKSLERYGFRHVFHYHMGLRDHEKRALETRLLNTPQTILVTNEPLLRQFQVASLPSQVVTDSAKGLPPVQVFYWHPPVSIDEALLEVFRDVPEVSTEVSTSPMQVTFLHTREDVDGFEKRLEYQLEQAGTNAVIVAEQLKALKRYREWILSASCRRQTLVAYHQANQDEKMTQGPCRECDRCCNQKRLLKGRLRKFIERLLY